MEKVPVYLGLGYPRDGVQVCVGGAAVANRWMRRRLHDLQPDRLAA